MRQARSQRQQSRTRDAVLGDDHVGTVGCEDEQFGEPTRQFMHFDQSWRQGAPRRRVAGRWPGEAKLVREASTS
jgi:hypothetical protein